MGLNADENGIQWDALRWQASRFTYCIIDESGQAIGSAIAVKLQNRFFFASAKHVIDNDHELRILTKGSMQPATSSDFIERRCDDQNDVGFLELSPRDANRFEFIDSTKLLREIDTEIELPTIVVGYPCQFIQSTEKQVSDTLTLNIHRTDALNLRSVVLPESEWPDNSLLQEPLIFSRDMLVDFQPEQKVRHVYPGISASDVQAIECLELDPHGVSGGGIWLAQVEERNQGLRIPDVHLIGIQTGWYRQNGWLRGHRIGIWLDIVTPCIQS